MSAPSPAASRQDPQGDQETLGAARRILATAPLLPGATLGVLGGGQLGRMFVQAAHALGYRTVVLDPDSHSPAGAVAHMHLHADYEDRQALVTLAGDADAITIEFENVPATALAWLADERPVAPPAGAVAICQDRLAEKARFMAAGVPCAPHARIAGDADLAAVPDALLPGVLKALRMGYDGKAQARVATRAELAQAWERLGYVPCVLEQQLDLWREVSAIVVRGGDGAMTHFPLQQNHHEAGILAVTQVPAPDVPPALAEQAIALAAQLAEAMHYVGVLCVEFFIVRAPDGALALLANEMAPRPHNSGHHTIDSCDASQFDLQVRALAGLPLVAPRQHSPVVMLNLLGDLWLRGDGTRCEPDWPAVLALPGVHLHLYGKREPRAGRKMGHLSVTATTAEAARAVAAQVAQALGLPPLPSHD